MQEGIIIYRSDICPEGNIYESLEWNLSQHINFIDFEKPFDIVPYATLLSSLAEYPVPIKIFNTLTHMHTAKQ